MSETATEAVELIKSIRPLLAGHEPAIQAAALADLLAAFLAGHVVFGNKEATEKLRDAYLTLFIELVRQLIEPNYQASVEPQLKRKTQ